MNGSLSESTMTKLQLLQSEASKSAWEVNPRRSNKESTNPLDDKGSNSDANKVIKSFFSKFKEIYALTSTLSQLRIAVTETLKDFRADGVVYLELRSTPRAVPNEYTKKEYIESVVGVIREFNNEQDEVITRFIVSIDRRHSIHESLAVIEMVKEVSVD